MTHPDAVVVGGGIAGSAAAILLAQAGKRIILLEKEMSAHDKVCGEFLSYEAQDYLHLLGINLTRLGAVPINHVKLTRGKMSGTINLAFKGQSISRKVLDEALLNRAEQLGVEIRRGCNVNALSRQGPLWHIGVVGKGHPLLADTVFLATGKHDLNAMPRGKGVHNHFIGFKMHFKPTPEQRRAIGDNVEISFFKGGYAGLEPVDEGKLNLCLVINKDEFKALGKRWDLLLAKMMNETPSLAERLSSAIPEWHQPLAIFKIPYGYLYRDTPQSQEGLYKLGDQMAVIPSFCGDGMSIALQTAFQASRNYLHADSKTYHAEEYNALLHQLRFATCLARFSKYRLIQYLLIFSAKILPVIISKMVHKTRVIDSQSLQHKYEGT